MDFSKLDITDDIVFSCVMRSSDICKSMLEYLLPGLRIKNIVYLGENGERLEPQPETQKFISGPLDRRGVRLDVYLDDDKTIYNIEMQTGATSLAKRARLYQAHIDINQLGRGQDYESLKPCYVIFICKYDPFGQDRYMYTFQNRCDQMPEELLGDGTYKCFFNTGGHVGDIPERLRELLTYMNNTAEYDVDTSGDELIKRINAAVADLKQDKDWRREYMVYELKLHDKWMEGMREGERNGTANMLLKMIKGGMSLESIAGISGISVEEIKELTVQAYK